MSERLDVFLTHCGLCDSRQKAQVIIKNAQVSVNGTVVLKNSFLVDEKDDIKIIGEFCEFVGRGGLKLKKALEVFPIEVKDKICIDIGASTGGFTDCLLQNGAQFVYALDVGHGQLDLKLLKDSRVKNMEGTNIRDVSFEEFEKQPTLAVCDVSFISLKLVLPHIKRLLSKNSQAVILIKPQFEAGKEYVKKGGIVKDKKAHVSVINSIIACALENGFSVNSLDFSPIKGKEGNVEYLLFLTLKEYPENFVKDIKTVVETAFLEHNT